MKQKHADRPNWGRILEKRYFQEYIQDEQYEGYVTYLLLDNVREPLLVKYEVEDICIADNGYSWIMFFPKDKLYSLTVMINKKYEVVQWYFDIIKSMELTDKGIPIINDMFLDFIYLPNGKIYIKDEEELKHALEQGLINQEEYSIATQVGMELQSSLADKTNQLINDSNKYIKLLKLIREDGLANRIAAAPGGGAS
jgi:predicted RNA-binding protein associated with RNAse of E/G family